MSGLSDAQEVSVLNSVFNTTLYLRFLTGTAGQMVNDDGTLPGGCTEVSGGGYAPLAIPSSYWTAAIAGSPTTKQMPRAANSPVSITLTTSWTTCGYAWTSDTNAISASNYVSGGVWVDINSTPVVVSVGANNPFQITSSNPIIERLGDPPVGVNPT